MTTSPQEGEWPRNAEGLAAIIRDESRPQQDHERALRELHPTIRRVARRVVVRFAQPRGQNNLDDAIALVWQAR
jgi:hypothetical protein